VPPPVVEESPWFATGGMVDYTWHLSVIDAGRPRGQNESAPLEGLVWRTALSLDPRPWYQQRRLRAGHWTLRTKLNATDGSGKVLEYDFGLPDGVPIVGDWNGDGIDEIGIYYKGQWFLDLNGDGTWDESDLWAQLGNEFDSPVAGDWNGDGKDDIGIFGTSWAEDNRALFVESGVPDLRNHEPPRVKPKNMPPTEDEATNGLRLLKRTAQGQLQADAIDHVFRYGGGRQIPVVGDWNGDGIKNIGVFHDGRWRLDMDGDGRSSDGDVTVDFGQAGDLPVVGDFNGDGVDEIGVYRHGTWIIDINHNYRLDAHDQVFALGGPGDVPVVGDWDGDGADDPGVYQPAADEAPHQAKQASPAPAATVQE
jgi:hypothetical protein